MDVRERLSSTPTLSHTLKHFSPNACIAKNIFLNRASSLITLKAVQHQCNGCERKVIKYSHLISHFETSHPKCMYCQKYFLKSSQLPYHFESCSASMQWMWEKGYQVLPPYLTLWNISAQMHVLPKIFSQTNPLFLPFYLWVINCAEVSFGSLLMFNL